MVPMLYRAEPKVHQGSAFAVARFLNNPALPFGENSGSLGLSLLLEGLESLLGTLALRPGSLLWGVGGRGTWVGQSRLVLLASPFHKVQGLAPADSTTERSLSVKASSILLNGSLLDELH